jgi:large repetitive protein
VRRGAAPLLGALVALALAAPAHAAQYVGMGDSYSAGNGTESSYDDNCDRSFNGGTPAPAYPVLVGNLLQQQGKIANGSFVNLSCSGAQTGNITSTAQMPGNPTAQMLAPGGLGPDTKYVTLMIGGNDVGFSSVLTDCGNPFGDCDSALADAEQKAQTELPGRLDATYAAVRSHAPNATIVVVGYPRIFRPGQSCNTFFSAHEVDELNGGSDLLNQVIGARARAAGLAYVNAIPTFIGHGACDGGSGSSTEWINGLSLSQVENSYHPKASGHANGYFPLVRDGILNVPDTTITSHPPDLSNSAAPQFGLGSTVPGSTFQCKLDGGSFAACSSPKSYTGLGQGSHTFTARAVNPNGDVDQFPTTYTWRVDTVAPSLTLDPGGPTGTVADDSASFGFSSSDPTATFECKLDPGSFAACSSPQGLSALADGEHTFTVRATDQAGNSSTASRTWIVDTTPPQASLNATPGDPTPDTDASFGFSLDDPDATAECSLDGADFAACDSPAEVSGLADGVHSFSVRGVDPVGNVGPEQTFSWTVDTTATGVTIDSAPAGLTNRTTALFGFSVDDSSATLTCSLDEAAFEPCDSSSSQAYTGLSDGEHTFTVKATDGVGNFATDSHGWAIDTIAPTASIAAGPSGMVGSSDASFELGSDDPGAELQCRLDGSPSGFQPCASPSSYSGLEEGAHTFEVRAVDAAGNAGAPASRSWTVDTAPPTALITSRPDNPTDESSATFGFSSSKPGSTFRCRLDSSDPGAFQSCGGPAQNGAISVSDLVDGTHSFDVIAVSPGGRESAPASYIWRVDTAAPSVTIDTSPPPRSGQSGAGFTFHASEAGVTYQCSLDSGTFVSCSSPRTYPALADGGHSFAVRAIDQVGNVGDATSYFWTQDTTPPSVAFDSGPGNGATINSPSVAFAFHASEEAARECKLSGPGITAPQFGECDPQGPPDLTAGTLTRSGLADGTYTLAVRAIDVSGHVSSEVSRTWTVDTTGPTVAITGGPRGTVASSSATLIFTSGGSAETVECALDAEPFAPCSSPKPYDHLGDGPHTFTVRARDEAGNESTDSRSWTIDTTPAQTFIDGPPPATTTSTEATVSFSADEGGSSFQCSLDGAVFAACSSPAHLSGLAFGDHSFRVRAIDPVGNLDQSPAVALWRVEEPPGSGDVRGAETPSPAPKPKPKCKKKRRKGSRHGKCARKRHRH